MKLEIEFFKKEEEKEGKQVKRRKAIDKVYMSVFSFQIAEFEDTVFLIINVYNLVLFTFAINDYLNFIFIDNNKFYQYK